MALLTRTASYSRQLLSAPPSAAPLLGPRWVRALAAIGALAVVSRLAYGPGRESYDPMWSLVWGRQLVQGEVPDVTVVDTAPTPHPLAILVGAVASLFGDDGPAVLSLLSFLSLGLLGWAGFRLTRSLFGSVVGVGVALLFVTREPVVWSTLQALIDIPFLAFVIWAAALEAERPRRGLPVLALLGVAGLLRPEAWLLSGAYLIYLLPRGSPRLIGQWVIAAAVAPVAWMAFDLITAGNALHSLQGTQELADRLGRPRGAGTALLKLPGYLEFVLPEPLLWAGLVGALTGVGLLYRRSILPAYIVGLGLVSFLVLGIAELPLLYRYVFLPGLMLSLFAAVALLGWLRLPDGRPRTIWRWASVPAAAVLAALWLPEEIDRLTRARDRGAAARESQRSQRSVVETPSTRALLHRCLPLYVRSGLQRPTLAYRLEMDPGWINSGRTFQPHGSAILVSIFPPPTPGYRRRGGNQLWTVWSSCGATSFSVPRGLKRRSRSSQYRA